MTERERNATAPPAPALGRALLLVAGAGTLAALCFLPAPAVRFARTTADEPQYLLSAISLGEDGDLDIADELQAERWREFHAAPLPRQTEPRDDGSEVSPHDPGLPVLLAGPVALGGWAGAKAALAAIHGGFAALLLWTAVRRGAVSPAVAVPAVLAFTVAPPLAVYGAQIYPELPAACAVTGIVALAGAAWARMAAIAGIVALAAAAAWLSVKYAPVAGLAGAGALWPHWRAGARSAVAGALAAVAVLAAVYAVVHVRVYGGLTAYASGDFFAATGGQLAVMGDRPNRLARSQRLIGLLVDRDFGLVAWQPAWLLVVPALAAMLARRPGGWALIAAPLAAGWAMATWIAVTMHGWWWPGRHVVHALPLAVLAVAWWLGRLRHGMVVAWIATAVGALSSLWLAVETVAGDVTLVFDPWSTTSPVHRAIRPLLPDLRADRALDVTLLVVWAVLLVAAATLAWRAGARSPFSPRRRGAGTPRAATSIEAGRSHPP